MTCGSGKRGTHVRPSIPRKWCFVRRYLALCAVWLPCSVALAGQTDLAAFEWGAMPTASAAVPDMSFRPRMVTDGKTDTGWIAPAEYRPLWLRLEWRFPVAISSVTFRQFPGGSPTIRPAYDLYNLADLADLAQSDKRAQYKLCLFLNPFYLQPEEVKLLDLAKGGGRTLVWLYTPGLAQPSQHLLPENVARIIDMPGLKLLQEPVEPTCRFTAPSPLTAGLPDGYELAPRPFAPGDFWERYGNALNPLPYLDPKATDAQTQTLGHWVIGAYGGAGGQVRPDLGAFAGKKLPAYTSVYSAVPYLSRAVLRNLAKMAGAHVYRDSEDILYANRHFVCVHTGANPATDVLRLPARSPVYDVFNGRLISPSADRFQLQVPAYTTALFYLGDPAPLQKALGN